MLDPQIRLKNSIIEGNLAITKRLLSRFPELWLNSDSKNNGWTNLHYASYYGKYLICYHLVSFFNREPRIQNNVSKLDLITFDNLTVLHLSCMKHHAQTLHYLLQEFPGELWLNYAGANLKQTPLHFCCVYGFLEGVKLLLDFGADWRVQDANGNTALHLCLEYDNFHCIGNILRHALLISENKTKGMQAIEEFEETKNFKGFKAIDLTYSFSLQSKYNRLKQELATSKKETSHIWGLNGLGSSDSLLNVSELQQDASPEKKVLLSPIVPMSSGQAFNPIMLNFNEQSCSSLPSQIRHRPSFSNTSLVSEDTKNRMFSRVFSTSLQPVKAPVSATISSLRASPSENSPLMAQSFVNKTPSLKSVTISPLVRSTSNENENSPQSILSFNSNKSLSPGAYRRKSYSVNMSPQATDHDQSESHTGSSKGNSNWSFTISAENEATKDAEKDDFSLQGLPRKAYSTAALASMYDDDKIVLQDDAQKDERLVLLPPKQETSDVDSPTKKGQFFYDAEDDSKVSTRPNINSISFNRVR